MIPAIAAARGVFSPGLTSDALRVDHNEGRVVHTVWRHMLAPKERSLNYHLEASNACRLRQMISYPRLVPECGAAASGVPCRQVGAHSSNLTAPRERPGKDSAPSRIALLAQNCDHHAIDLSA